MKELLTTIMFLKVKQVHEKIFTLALRLALSFINLGRKLHNLTSDMLESTNKFMVVIAVRVSLLNLTLALKLS